MKRSRTAGVFLVCLVTAGRLNAQAAGPQAVAPQAAGPQVAVPRAAPSQAAVPASVAAADLAPLFRDSPFNPGNRHGIPWQWGLTGIAYRRDLVEAPTSWRVFVDDGGKAAGRMTMLDDVREVLGAMLRLRGRSLNSTDPAELAEARSDAIAAKAHLAAFVSAGQR